jgi:hypothetical protein
LRWLYRFAETNNEKAVKDSGQKVTYNSDGISTKTVTKVGEATYYYEDSNDYRICIGSYPSGIFDIAYLDKSNPDTLYVSNMKLNLSNDNPDSMNRFHFITLYQVIV